MGAAYVFKARRTDPVLYLREDEVAGNAIIYGETPSFDTLTSDALWQIKMVSYESGQEVTRFANHGKYNCVWDDREDYFSDYLPIVGPDFPDETISVSNKPGLVGPANHFDVTLNKTTWTALPTQVSQQVINIYNDTTDRIRLNFNNTDPVTKGSPLDDQSAKSYDVQEAVVIYAVLVNLAAATLDVELISG